MCPDTNLLIKLAGGCCEHSKGKAVPEFMTNERDETNKILVTYPIAELDSAGMNEPEYTVINKGTEEGMQFSTFSEVVRVITVTERTKESSAATLITSSLQLVIILLVGILALC